MDDEKPKKRAICPSCGEWNWKPLTYYQKKTFDESGRIIYIIGSKSKYVCKKCKCKWTETWEDKT